MKRTKIEDLPLWERQVLSLIRHGKANSITVKEIISVIGGTDYQVRKTVNHLIQKHKYLIGTNNGMKHPGFFFPQTEEEKEEAVEKMFHRANEISNRASIMNLLPLVEMKDVI